LKIKLKIAENRLLEKIKINTFVLKPENSKFFQMDFS